MLVSLILPTVLSAIAVFFASFLSWMIVKLHEKDWVKIEKEDEFLKAGREIGLKPGNYMFPHCAGGEDMKNEEYQKKAEAGPIGVLSVFPPPNMGKNMGLTFVYFLAVSFCLGYLATLANDRGAAFFDVFRFVMTAGILAYLPAILQHAIWFKTRVVGHIIESIVYAAITGAIFAALWPGAS